MCTPPTASLFCCLCPLACYLRLLCLAQRPPHTSAFNARALSLHWSAPTTDEEGVKQRRRKNRKICQHLEHSLLIACPDPLHACLSLVFLCGLARLLRLVLRLVWRQQEEEQEEEEQEEEEQEEEEQEEEGQELPRKFARCQHSHT